MKRSIWRTRPVVCALFALGFLALASRSAAALELRHSGSRWNANGNFLYEFSLTNSSSDAVEYDGYHFSLPVYTSQTLRNNQWKDDSADWCGVNLETRQLAPRQAVTLSLSPPDDARAWRVGIPFRPAATNAASAQIKTAWSPSVRPKSRKELDAHGKSAAPWVETQVALHRDGNREQSYEFSLRNKSTNTLYYGGFREPDVPPIYLNQERRTGRWHDNGHANWSGSDLGFKQLLPGQSISFKIPAQSLDRSWRIGIRLFRTDSPGVPEDAYLPVWWIELPPREMNTEREVL